MLFVLLFPLQLELVKQGVKLDNPGHLEKLSICIERCQHLKKASLRIFHFKGRQQLLQEMQEELKWMSHSTGRTYRSRSSTEDIRPSKKKPMRMRRNSEMLGKIKEEPDGEGMVTNSFSLPRVSSRKLDKRPTTLTLSPPKGLIVERKSSLKKSSDDKRSSSKLRTAGSLVSKEGMKKRWSSEIRPRTRFIDPIEIVEEEEDYILVPALGDGDGTDRSSRHSPPPTRGISPKESRLDGEEVSIEYMADVEEDLGSPDNMVLENHLTASPIPSGMHDRVKEENCHQANANATSLPPVPVKKKVAFKKRSGSPPSPHLQTVWAEVHYSNEGAAEKEVEWKEVEEETADGRLRSMESSLPLHTTEAERIIPDSSDASITSDTQLFLSNETSGEHLEEKSNSVSSNVRCTKQILMRKMKRSMSPGFSAINKLSMSQPCVVSDDQDQLLDMCGDGSSKSQGLTSAENGVLVKSHSADYTQKHLVNSNCSSQCLSYALKEGMTNALSYRGQRSNSEMTMEGYNDDDDDDDAGRNL